MMGINYDKGVHGALMIDVMQHITPRGMQLADSSAWGGGHFG